MPTDDPYYQPTRQFENERYWRQYLGEHGVVATVAHAKQMRAGPAAYAETTINKYLKEQEISRDEREIEAHAALKRHNARETDKSYTQVEQGKWQIFLAFVCAFRRT